MVLALLSEELVGKVIGKPILSGNGNVLLTAGTILTFPYIEKLSKIGYQRVYLLDGQTDDVEILESLSPITRSKALSVVTSLALATNANDKSAPLLKLDPITQVVDAITQDVMASPLIIAACADIKSFDEYTFHHCANTCVVSLQLGLKLVFPKTS